MNTNQMIEVMKAYENGKQIQAKDNNTEKWYDVGYPDWNWADDMYRVKPETDYRPYNCVEELIDDRGGDCFIFVKLKNGNNKTALITGYDFDNDKVCLCLNWYDMNYVFEYFEHTDGTPFGIKIEE